MPQGCNVERSFFGYLKMARGWGDGNCTHWFQQGCAFLWSVQFLWPRSSIVHHQPAPATYNCGSTLIDGIFILTHLIPHCYSGYLNFGDDILSNHKVVWLDILVALICHTNSDQPVHAPAQRLQCKDTRIVQQYNDTLFQQITLHNIPARLTSLEQQSLTGWLSKSQQVEYKWIDHEMVVAKCLAEWTCCKIMASAVPWCPQVTWCIYCILYWKGLARKFMDDR